MKRTEANTDFEKLYLHYFPKLKRFAKEYVINEGDAENIAQDVFVELWEQRGNMPVYTNLLAYLFTSVKNRCLNFLRHKTVVKETSDILQNEYMFTLQMNLNSLEAFNIEYSEADIDRRLRSALDALPPKCRKIFLLNKIEGKKQKEIAAELNISIHTVETQMGIAYKKLRVELQDIFILFLFLFH